MQRKSADDHQLILQLLVDAMQLLNQSNRSVVCGLFLMVCQSASVDMATNLFEAFSYYAAFVASEIESYFFAIISGLQNFAAEFVGMPISFLANTVAETLVRLHWGSRRTTDNANDNKDFRKGLNETLEQQLKRRRA